MPKRNGQGNVPEEQDVNILAEDQDMADELEENVGVPPRKVTMEEFVGAEDAFNNLVDSEEEEFETMPFRPGKNARFVLNAGQKTAIQDCIDEFQKYIDVEIGRHKLGDDPANKKLVELQGAMKRLLEVGLDGLNPDERKAIEGFNETMNTEYRLDGGKSLSAHMHNYSGTYDLKMNNIHYGLDTLGVMTGKTAAYSGNRAERYLNSRASARADKINTLMLHNSEEGKELRENAESAGLDEIQNKFEGTEIGDNLQKIKNIVGDFKNWTYGRYSIEDHLKAADGLGAFLNATGKNGKKNYDTIAEAFNGMKQGAEKKKAFDLLLGQLNTVCNLNIGIADAIEAGEQYKWDKTQKKEVDANRINALNDKVFGADSKVHSYDHEFLDSVDTLSRMLKKTHQDHLRLYTDNQAKMWGAHLGFETLSEKVRGNHGFAKLSVNDKNMIHLLDFGKTLYQKEKLETGKTKTMYELLVQTYEENGKTKEDLDNTLQELNDKMDLKIAIPGKKLGAGEKAPSGPVEQSKPYVRKIKEVQRSSNKMEDPVKLKAALASVLALRRMSVDPAHKDHTKVRTTAVLAKAKALMDTEAFKEMTKDMDADTIAKKIYHPGNFDKEFTKKLVELDQAKYAQVLQEKGANALAKSAAIAAKKMDDTGTGVYMLGIKRGSNSGMYDRAVLAMQRASKNPDPATTMTSVQAVREYLSNKMTVRKSPSGQERWKNCMNFLHEAMPKEEFKAYCDEINKARKVKEGSPNYIEPDDFAPKTRRNSMTVESKKNIENESAEQNIERQNSI